MKQLHTPVIYLETKDIAQNRIRGHQGHGVLLVQGDFCGYCTKLKPHYQHLAQEFFPRHFFTIQVDSSSHGEQGFSNGELVTQFVHEPVQGIPYLRKVRNGKAVGEAYHGDPTDLSQLRAWIQN